MKNEDLRTRKQKIDFINEVARNGLSKFLKGNERPVAINFRSFNKNEDVPGPGELISYIIFPSGKKTTKEVYDAWHKKNPKAEPFNITFK